MNPSTQFTFNAVPTDVSELLSLPEANLDNPHKTAALTMLALMRFETDPESCFAMLDALSGPQPLSPFAKSFIKERLIGKEYKPRSFFMGSSPQNNYTPSVPYKITISETPYSYPQEDRATLYVKSSGADSPRSIIFRKKPSTGQWFLVEIQCLSDIRLPQESDPWA